MAEQTLPWVQRAHSAGGSDWERAHRIRRALRGSSKSPGYIEDWQLAGALGVEDIRVLIEMIIQASDVSLALLCHPCRNYSGPTHLPALSTGWAA